MSCISIPRPFSKARRKLFSLLILLLSCLSGCSTKPNEKDFDDLEIVGSMELYYAKQFRADYLANGCALVSIKESGRFLIVPEGQEPPERIDEDITVLRQPVENIYLAATSAMGLFDALNALEPIAMSGTKAEGWFIQNAKMAMENGAIAYAGKYSAPDYEMLMAKHCGLAIESTMINHAPEVKEKLEVLGIPVMVERSSYEGHPLGRTEWIKLYGLLVGDEEQATLLFDEQVAYLESIPTEDTGKSVAFFYIAPSGNVVVRKNGDYAVKMIELAGGEYVFSDLGGDDSAAGSVNLEMERFYAEAKNADVIIYNRSVDGQVHSIDDLLAKNELLGDFKAVKNENVWCTDKSLFQETTEFGWMISEMNKIFSGDVADDLIFYDRLR